MSKGARRFAIVAATGTYLGVGALGYYGIAHYFDLPPQLIPEMVVRSSRTLVAGCIVAYDYKFNLPKDENVEHYEQLQKKVHLRTALRMLDVCRKNGGVYNKAGQHIASLCYIVPREYTETLSVLTDKAPVMSFAEVNEVMKKELGDDWRSSFAEFDEVPVAAASLAQVHRAKLKGGGDVAPTQVKVQFPAIARQLKIDLAAIKVCVAFIGRVFPKFEYTWVLPEFEDYMKMESNFEQEVRNNAKIKQLFSANKQFATPVVYPALCTKKVIVMEWVEGCKMNDAESIRKMGFRPEEVAQLVLDVFAEQVFVHGFLHSDPHAANAFVRPVKVGAARRPQLVLLDHGLYRTLKSEFQNNYANLWRALVLRNSSDVERYARALGAGENYKAFAFILTWRPFSSTRVGMSGGMTVEDMNEIIKEWEETDPNISRLLKGLDRDLLLVLRTQIILRGINVDLGGQVNRYKVYARAAIKGIHLRNNTSTLDYWWDRTTLEVKFWLAEMMLSWAAWWSPASDNVKLLSVAERY